MAYKFIDAAKAHWRPVTTPGRARPGRRMFHKLKPLERPVDITRAESPETTEMEVA